MAPVKRAQPSSPPPLISRIRISQATGIGNSVIIIDADAELRDPLFQSRDRTIDDLPIQARWWRAGRPRPSLQRPVKLSA